MQESIYIGIDNGVTGAIAMLAGKNIMAKCVMPIQSARKGNEVDIVAVWNWLSMQCTIDMSQARLGFTVVIEEPGGSKNYKAAVSMAGSFHALRAMCELHGIRWHRVTPQAWQKPMLHAKTGDTKPAALRTAKSLWPQEDWRPTKRSTNAHDGMIDAALIAEWARRERL